MDLELSEIGRGKVVSCHFPLAETPDAPGPIARPALVVQVFRDRVDGIMKAVVAYGTTRTTRANAGFEIRMNREEGLRKAGLTRPTRFTLSRMRILPLDNTFFRVASGGSPVLGCLDEGLMERLDAIFEALAGIAAPLRPLMGCTGQTVPVSHLEAAPQAMPGARAELDGPSLDRFMQRHLTGRADLNGIRKKSARR